MLHLHVVFQATGLAYHKPSQHLWPSTVHGKCHPGFYHINILLQELVIQLVRLAWWDRPLAYILHLCTFDSITCSPKKMEKMTRPVTTNAFYNQPIFYKLGLISSAAMQEGPYTQSQVTFTKKYIYSCVLVNLWLDSIFIFLLLVLCVVM